MIFNEEEQKTIHKMRDIFLVAKQKFYILKYINTTEKSHPLRNLLCEALFRNVILELYSILYDTTPDTIAKKIIDKLIKQLEINQGVFEFHHEIPFHNIDDGTVDVEIIEEKLKIYIDSDGFEGINLDIQRIRSKFKKYRNKVLAHRDYGKFDYHISQEDIETMVNESEKIITTLLSIIKSTSADCFDVSSLVNDGEIKLLFEVLSGNRVLNSNLYQKLF